MTINFEKFADFIVREFVAISEAPSHVFKNHGKLRWA